jgi:hypothetical protein
MSVACNPGAATTRPLSKKGARSDHGFNTGLQRLVSHSFTQRVDCLLHLCQSAHCLLNTRLHRLPIDFDRDLHLHLNLRVTSFIQSTRSGQDHVISAILS